MDDVIFKVLIENMYQEFYAKVIGCNLCGRPIDANNLKELFVAAYLTGYNDANMASLAIFDKRITELEQIERNKPTE